MVKKDAPDAPDSELESDEVFELAAEVFRVMSAPMRLKIISALCNGEKIVGVVSRPSPEAGGERLQTEWIVWVGDELKDDNYKAYRTLIVRPPSNSRGGRYTGTLYPKQ